MLALIVHSPGVWMSFAHVSSFPVPEWQPYLSCICICYVPGWAGTEWLLLSEWSPVQLVSPLRSSRRNVWSLGGHPESGRATSTLRYDTSTLREFKGSFLPYVAYKSVCHIGGSHGCSGKYMGEMVKVPGCSETSYRPQSLLQQWLWCGDMAKLASPLGKRHKSSSALHSTYCRQVWERSGEKEKTL